MYGPLSPQKPSENKFYDVCRRSVLACGNALRPRPAVGVERSLKILKRDYGWTYLDRLPGTRQTSASWPFLTRSLREQRLNKRNTLIQKWAGNIITGPGPPNGAKRHHRSSARLRVAPRKLKSIKSLTRHVRMAISTSRGYLIDVPFIFIPVVGSEPSIRIILCKSASDPSQSDRKNILFFPFSGHPSS